MYLVLLFPSDNTREVITIWGICRVVIPQVNTTKYGLHTKEELELMILISSSQGGLKNQDSTTQKKWILPDDVGAANALSPPEEAGGDPKASKKLVCCCGCAAGCCCGCWGGVPNAAKLGCDCCWTGCGTDDPNGSKVF